MVMGKATTMVTVCWSHPTAELRPQSPRAGTVHTRSWNRGDRMLELCTQELHPYKQGLHPADVVVGENVTTVYHGSYNQLSAMLQPCTQELQPATPSSAKCFNRVRQKLHPRASKLQPFWRCYNHVAGAVTATPSSQKASTVY